MKTTFTKNTAIRLLPFLVAAATGLATFLVARYFQIAIAFSIGADVFFVMYIVMILRRMPGLTAEHLRLKARSDDLPIFIIFAVVAVVIAVAIGSLFLIINANHKHPPLELLAALLSLPLGWITIHMMAALHYAHVYWRDDEVRDARGRPVRQPVGGLSFPGGDTPPQGWDFLYFAMSPPHACAVWSSCIRWSRSSSTRLSSRRRSISPLRSAEADARQRGTKHKIVME